MGRERRLITWELGRCQARDRCRRLTAHACAQTTVSRPYLHTLTALPIRPLQHRVPSPRVIHDRERGDLRVRRILVSTVLVAGLVAVPLPGVAQGGGGHCDFDGDGYDDAAIGVPTDDPGGVANAGAVNVLYGSGAKLTSQGDQLWTQDSPNVGGSAESSDQFGLSVECGDFNDDGFDDLAVGAAGEDVAGENNAGALHILFGSGSGLTADNSELIHRNVVGVAGQIDGPDLFGWSLAVGDFDDDGHDDLAVGANADSVGGADGAGSIQVFYGFAGGLSTSNDEIWHRAKQGVKGTAALGDQFGASLAAGDFDGDGYDDVAIGAPFDDIGGFADAGSVSVLYGSSDGVTGAGDDLYHRNSSGVKASPFHDDWFGHAVAAGDFDGDGYDDLAVSVPFDDPVGMSGAGSVQVLLGGPNGVKTGGDKVWHRAKKGIKGVPGAGDMFGWSLTTGRFDSGGTEDLAVGVISDEVGGMSAGSVHVIYGGGNGLTNAGDQIWHQGRKGVKGANEDTERFGSSVSAGDFNDNGEDDLLIGVPGEGVGAILGAGRVSVIYGKNQGLDAAGDQSWSQDSPGIRGVPENFDQMGQAVSGQATD